MACRIYAHPCVSKTTPLVTCGFPRQACNLLPAMYMSLKRLTLCSQKFVVALQSEVVVDQCHIREDVREESVEIRADGHVEAGSEAAVLCGFLFLQGG